MRRLLVPEIVQTSQMDCGPASLASLLSGCGIPASYGRLREACQTEVDGTSIDVMEVVANQLGLEAEQIMLPVDHLLLAESAALPAIVVVRQTLDQTHFVVVWRRIGPFVQIMDPAVGRRWLRGARLLKDVYVHTQRVPADAFEAWVRSPDFQAALVRRLRDLGAARAARTLLANAASEPNWRGLATLDAALRLTAALVRSGGVRAGRTASRLVGEIWRRALLDERSIPESFWFARPEPSSSTDAPAKPQVLIRGAVLVRALGTKPRNAQSQTETPSQAMSTELAAALTEPKPRPWQAARRMLGRGGGVSADRGGDRAV